MRASWNSSAIASVVLRRWSITSGSISRNTGLVCGRSRFRCDAFYRFRRNCRFPRFSAHFTPCVEVGWRLSFAYWGHGYATEGARSALRYGFGTLALSEIVSYTATTNRRSRALMNGLNCAADVFRPGCRSYPLRRHVLYRLGFISACTDFRLVADGRPSAKRAQAGLS